MKLDFVYIGPDKSGSTWLYNILAEHPDVFVPIAKDIYFFDRYYHRGLSWYEKFFKSAPEQCVVGEISHDYMFDPEAIRRIHQNYPDAKLLTILRNPYEKVWSQYLFLIRSGITNKPFASAIEEIDELTEKCLYGKYLSKYLKEFDPKKIKILFFDNLKKDPKKFAHEIFNFLEIKQDIDLNYYEKTLPASRPRNFYLAKLAKKSAILLREMGLINLLGLVKSNKIVQNLLYQPYKNHDKPKMQPSDYALVRDLFEEDIALLEQTLKIDLSHWKRGS
ncbi:putative deacetylase sulfotransferase [Hydrogenimonas sp.]|nr:putative deacetylase sulfotransferase [Hydrogenimonas sp.]